MNRDNDLLRAADQALRNAERRQLWRRKWLAIFGRDPDQRNLRSVESYFEEMRRCLADSPPELDRDDSPLCFSDDIIAPAVHTAQTNANYDAIECGRCKGCAPADVWNRRSGAGAPLPESIQQALNSGDGSYRP